MHRGKPGLEQKRPNPYTSESLPAGLAEHIGAANLASSVQQVRALPLASAHMFHRPGWVIACRRQRCRELLVQHAPHDDFARVLDRGRLATEQSTRTGWGHLMLHVGMFAAARLLQHSSGITIAL